MRLFEGTQWDRPPRCERCDELEESCTCPPPPKSLAAPEKQTARLVVEKRKRGKIVTIVRGLSVEENDLNAVLAGLKNACGAGGTYLDEDKPQCNAKTFPLRIVGEEVQVGVGG